ncbi:hypothetical protein [Nitrosophilus alvini]|uniref:hypothetical protein n=1 Tax=Nitrosophilus alvini TaxID=2714855 RepID=UPI00190C7295|nr:hypothetical protein [Nitrosophilus alvini]
MKIDSIAYLIGGELKNSPSISEITGFSFEASKVKRGDLFFAVDKEEIDEAVRNRAFGIVFEGWAQITDNEIAWIKTGSLENAALRLLRFFLINNQSKIIFLDSVSYEIAQQINDSKKLLFFTDSVFENCKKLYKNSDTEYVAISDMDFIKTLSLDFEIPKTIAELKIIKSTLFETSFLYENEFFEHIRISPLFINELKKTVGFFKNSALDFSLKKLHEISHFKPHFVDKHLNIVEFGKSDKVLITESNPSLLEKETLFINKNATWAKKVILAHSKYKKILGYNNNYLYFNSNGELAEILQNRKFNYALIAGNDISNITHFAKKPVQPTLF